MPRHMSLSAFLMPGGQHVAAWRHPEAQADAGVTFRYYKNFAQTAELGKFDAIFIADFAGSISSSTLSSARRSSHDIGFEPITLVSALATVTEKIGLIATVSTTFNEPFHLARKFASLDLISAGRAGWNLVTSVNETEAYNFGRDRHVLHAERYDRANEFADVVLGLWDSWEDDAFPRDKTSGQFFDPDKLHVLNHEGVHFSVRGPLNVARSPQGRPVFVQSGSSEPGKELAARTAEVVFTAHQTLASAKSFYGDLKSRLNRLGRSADHLKIMPGVFPVVGRTQAEAEDINDQLQGLVHPETGLALISHLIGFDLSSYPIDGPLPKIPETNGNKSRQRLLIDLAKQEALSIRQLYLRIAGARGHWTVVGSPAQVADHMEEWFLAGAADGFNVMPPVLPSSLNHIVDLLIPELQRRGLSRRAYEGRTLRDHLGLPRPQISQQHNFNNRRGASAFTQPANEDSIP
jgi:FMN-dependent oxidoreductase (nitrilotriacetate monooxygenase family)